MQVSTHTVVHTAQATSRPAASARHDASLGFCAVSFASAEPVELHQELVGAAAQLVLDTAHSHCHKPRDKLAGFWGSEAEREALLEVLTTAANLASREVDALKRRRKVRLDVTLDLVWIAGQECFVAHVGDGRIELLRKGLAHKLTQDHTEGEETTDSLSGADPATQPRTPLSRALGRLAQVEVETLSLQLAEGDRLLLSGPYLHRALDDLAIREAATDPDPDGLTARLIGLARDAGIPQDIACGLVSVGPLGEASRQPNSRLSTLARIPLFAYCTERELLAIAGITRPMRYRSGNYVFRQGDRSQGLFLLVQGTVDILKDGQVIAELGPGANFGEMSMLDQPERSASVRVQAEAEVLLITRAAFFSLLKRDPTLAVKVLWNMLLRLSASLRSTSGALSELQNQIKEAE